MDDDDYSKLCPHVHAFFESHAAMRPQMPVYCPHGWDGPVSEALEELSALASETGVHINLMQVKEKLAGLRIYVKVYEVRIGETKTEEFNPALLGHREAHGSVRVRAHEIIKAAEARCSTACQQCGLPGWVCGDATGLSVLCGEHARGTGTTKQPRADR